MARNSESAPLNLPDPFELENESSSDLPDIFGDEPEELENKQPELSKSEVLGRTIAQGTTLGLADELAGAAGALGFWSGLPEEEKKKYDNNIFRFLSESGKYKEVRDIEREKLKQAEEESPGLSATGAIAGGLLTAPIGGAVGLASKAPGVLGAVRTGVAGGAAYGLGQSEAETAPELLEDVKTSALAGGALGGAVGAIGKAAAASKDSSVLAPFKKAFGFGREGEKLFGLAAQEKIGMEPAKAGQKLQNFVTEATKDVGSNIESAVKAASDKGVSINKRELLGKSLSQIDDALKEGKIGADEAQYLKNEFSVLAEEFKPGVEQVNPDEAWQIIKRFQNRAYGGLAGKQNLSPNAIKAAKFSARESSNLLKEKVPGLDKLMPDYSAMKEAQELIDEPELIRALGVDRASKKAVSTVEKMAKEFQPAEKQRIEDLFNILKKVKGEEAETLQSQLQKTSEKYSLTKGAATGTGISIPQQFVGTVKDLGVKLSNVAGLKTKEAQDYIANTVKKLTPSELQAIGEDLAKQGSKGMSQIFNEMAKKDERGRNALLFSLMQNPAYREMLGLDKQQEPTKESE